MQSKSFAVRIAAIGLIACLVISAPTSIRAAESGIQFKELAGTNLPEILAARHAEVAAKVMKENLGHQWWLWGLSALDYDNDGDLDLIVCIHGPSNGLILKNQWKETGKFTFVDATKQLGADWLVPGTDNYPMVWDFDGDGYLDIAGLLDDSRTPSLWNRGGKRFERADFSFHPINYPSGLTDLNDDGFLDLYQDKRGKRTVLMYDPKEKSFLRSETEISPPARLPDDVRRQLDSLRQEKRNRFIKYRYWDQHDLNADGRRDLVISGFGSYSGDRVGWYLLDEAGKLADRTKDMNLPREGTPFFFDDVDADGDVDLLIASGEQGGLMLNDGAGRFTLVPGELTDFVKRRCPYLPVAFRADLDNDGDQDLAISDRRYGNEQVFENRGDGQFVRVLKARGWDADPLVLEDINQDGLVDVIVGGPKDSISIFLNQTASDGCWCKLYPRMKPPNVYAVGTRVEVYAPGALGESGARPLLVEQAHANATPIHVGLGKHPRFDLRIHFPGQEPIEKRNITAQPGLQIQPDGKIEPYAGP